jgi:hypothetical protein
MTQQFILAPRYRLDDEFSWLEGIDPSRHYWISVNSDSRLQVSIPGLIVSSIEELREVISRFRSLQPQESMTVDRIAGSGFTLHCISSNCYAIEDEVAGFLTWHLFDKESIESLLMTSHPDWLPSPKDIELGRKRLALAFEQPAYTSA